MQMYQSTPDFYRDYIEHGWLKDQTAKAHKYIERWKGKNGKWYYRYKSKVQGLGAKMNRSLSGIHDPEIITDRNSTWGKYSSKIKSTPIQKRVGSAKANSQSGRKGVRLNAGITAGRKRTTAQRFLARKGSQNKKGKNLRQRGYASSKTYNRNDGVSELSKAQGYADTSYNYKQRSNEKMTYDRYPRKNQATIDFELSAANYLNNKYKKKRRR